MKRSWFRIAVLSLLVLAFSSEMFAQTRIRFARGRTSASVSGSLGAGASRDYVVGARSGQTFSANVSSRNGCVKFSWGGTSRSFETRGGDNVFGVTNHCSRATNFTMTISIY